MAIYRPPKSRWPLVLAVGAVALVIGVAVGALASRDEEEPVDAASEIQSQLLGAAGSVEVAGIEYSEAVAGEEVVSEPEYAGALDALASSRSRYLEVRDALTSLAPGRVDALDAAFDAVEKLMADTADPQEVTARLEELEGLLKGTGT